MSIQTDDCVNSFKIVEKFQHLKISLVNHGSIIVFDNYEFLNNYEKDLNMEAKSFIFGNKLIEYYFKLKKFLQTMKKLEDL